MTSEIRANTLKNRVGLGTVSYTNTGIIVSGIVTANSFSGPYNGTDIVGTGITLTSTDAGSAAGPELKLFRNSASPANADYLGQLKFAGESSTGVERNYAKITGKILDVTNGSEDGILEFAHIKGGSQTITGRWRSDSLQLLNSTNFSVAGNAEVTGTTTLSDDLNVDSGTLFVDVSSNRIGINQASPSKALDVVGSAEISSALTVGGALNASGTCTLGQTVSINGTNPQLQFVDSNHNPDYSIYGSNGRFSVYDATNSAERFRINSTGKIAFNYDVTASDPQYGQVEIFKNGASNVDSDWSYLCFHRVGEIGWQQGIDSNHFVIATTGGSAKNTLDAEKLRITSSGNVLVGGHAAQLSSYNSGQPRLSIYGSGGSGGYLELGGNLPHNTHSSGTILFINNTNSEATSNNANGKILAMQRVENVTSDTNSGNDMGGDLVFMTKPDGGSLDERLRIDSGGRVLIGTTSPLSFNGVGQYHNLIVAGTWADTDITDNSHAAITISNKDGTANNTAGLHFAREDNDGNPHYDGASIVAQFKDSMNTGQYPRADLVFLTSTANNNAPSEKLRITSTGSIQQSSGTGVSYFNGSSEFIFGSTTSSPPAGGYESLLQVHTSKTRSAFTLAGYNSNSGGPFMTFLSSRSTTRGTLGSKVQSNDYIGSLRFTGDNGTNYNSVAHGATIWARAKSTPGDGDTAIAGELHFATGTANAGSVTDKMVIQNEGQLDLKRGRVNDAGHMIYRAGGRILGTATVSLDIPVLNDGNIYWIEAFYTHHSLAYGGYLYGVYGAYSGHNGLQINNTIGSSTSGGSNVGTWSVSRGNSGTPIVVAKSAGSYGGAGHYWIHVHAGSPANL